MGGRGAYARHNAVRGLDRMDRVGLSSEQDIPWQDVIQRVPQTDTPVLSLGFLDENKRMRRPSVRGLCVCKTGPISRSFRVGKDWMQLI